jgi:hypothetical protein
MLHWALCCMRPLKSCSGNMCWSRSWDGCSGGRVQEQGREEVGGQSSWRHGGAGSNLCDNSHWEDTSVFG